MKNVKEKLRSKLREDFFEFLKHSKNYVSADLFIKGLSIISIPIFTRHISLSPAVLTKAQTLPYIAGQEKKKDRRY